MRRRSRNRRRCGLAMLMLVALLVSAPASTSEQDLVEWNSGPNCASSMDGLETDAMDAEGSPNLGPLNCTGAPTGCGQEYM